MVYNKFYLSGTMIQKSGADLILDCGDTYKNFNEDYLLNNYKKYTDWLEI